MKIAMLSLGIVIAAAAGAFWIWTSHRLDATSDARVRAVHVEDLRKRYKAELEDDRIERETEALLWDAPMQLTQQRALISQELIDDQAQEKDSAWKDDPPNPAITLEKGALARIDARVKELETQNAKRSSQYEEASR